MAAASPGAAAEPAPEQQVSAPDSGVKIRMYRQGLGDCFLVTFATEQQDKPFYLVIDSGVILGTHDPVPIMTKVANSLFAATGGHIHLLIATHEHWDHVSGFHQAKDVWAKFQIDKVWMAWTEDPNDALGVSLKKEFNNDLEALHLAVQSAGDSAHMANVAGLVEMFGGLAATGDSKFSANTHEALESLRAFAKGNVEYRYPGEVKALPGVPDARVYVLGPPRSEALLRNVNPSAKDPQTYVDKNAAVAPRPLAISEKAAFTLAVRQRLTPGSPSEKAARIAATPLTPEEEDLSSLCYPFDQSLHIPWQAATHDPFFVEHYGLSAQVPGSTIQGADWRRINDDWLGVAGELALQMDSYTNNTSLAIAIELTRTGKVLLFAADAQVGNWMSWDAIKMWAIAPAEQAALGANPQKTVADLLAKTVFYKVGHHGSHNATMREQGLERMSNDLVAFLPVDEQVAHTVKRWMFIPFTPLLERLRQKTQGRIVRVDSGVPTEKPQGVDDTVWKTFLNTIKATDLFIEYPVEDI